MEEGIFKTEWGRKIGLGEIAGMEGAWGFRLAEVEYAAAVATAAAAAAAALPVAAAAMAAAFGCCCCCCGGGAVCLVRLQHMPETVVCGGGARRCVQLDADCLITRLRRPRNPNFERDSS